MQEFINYGANIINIKYEKVKMQLDVGSEPTFKLAYMPFINVFFGKVTPHQQKIFI